MTKTTTSVDKHIHEQIKENAFTIISHYGLTEYEVVQIVKEWYTSGMYNDILQDENGNDLEEICNNICEELE